MFWSALVGPKSTEVPIRVPKHAERLFGSQNVLKCLLGVTTCAKVPSWLAKNTELPPGWCNHDNLSSWVAETHAACASFIFLALPSKVCARHCLYSSSLLQSLSDTALWTTDRSRILSWPNDLWQMCDLSRTSCLNRGRVKHTIVTCHWCGGCPRSQSFDWEQTLIYNNSNYRNMTWWLWSRQTQSLTQRTERCAEGWSIAC